MGKHAVLITADGREIKMIDGDLETLQGAVGGYIENVPMVGAPFVMFVNEEGKIHNLPHNQLATELADRYRDWNDPLVGDAVLVGHADGRGENADFTMDEFFALFEGSEAPFGIGRATTRKGENDAHTA